MVCVGTFCHVVFKAPLIGASTVVIAFLLCASCVGVMIKSVSDVLSTRVSGAGRYDRRYFRTRMAGE
jgi:hypothetical protein